MKKTLVLLFSIALLISACNRNQNEDPAPETPTSMEDLEVSQNFDWKTTQNYQLKITGTTSNIIKILSEDGVTYQSAFITANVTYNTKLTVPSYEKKIRLKYSGQEVILDLDSETINYDFQ
mgnify:CR=1 FL=1